MGLLEDLQRAPEVLGDKCSVQTFLEAHPKEADAIWEIVMGSEVSGAHIARVFGDYGLKIGSDTVNRHRRGECACELRMPERYV